MQQLPEPDHTILIVEDSDDDYDALVRALNTRGSITNPLHRCKNGQEALDYLFRRGAYQSCREPVRPSVILLDLNMPGVDGHGVLAVIKATKALMSIPVIVMTTSGDERDIEACYQNGANAYIQKPFSSSKFLDVISTMTDFWMGCVTLPESQKISAT